VGNLVLLGSLTVVVVGSLVGSWAAIQGILGIEDSFMWGHQGYEYIELGRVWQVLLIVGDVCSGLFLMYRAFRPALQQEKSPTGLSHFFLYSAITIPLFYSVGLFLHEPDSVEYCRILALVGGAPWGRRLFEVFATVVIAYLCSELGFLKKSSALRATYLTTSSTWVVVLWERFTTCISRELRCLLRQLGLSFCLGGDSLTLIGFEVLQTLKLSREAEGSIAGPTFLLLPAFGIWWGQGCLVF
jgi:nitric oxide reductase subunit B